jgi:glutamate/aspartate transport system substrate-binding protein
MRISTAVMSLVMVAAMQAPVAVQADTLDRIKSTGTITIGYVDASPPFASSTAGGKPEGFSIDLCQRIVAGVRQSLGLAELTVKYVPVTSETRISKIESGEIDIECGSTTRTLSRQARVDFTLLTFVTGTELLVGLDSKIDDIANLDGKKVAVLPSTTTEAVIKGLLKQRLVNAAVVSVKDHEDGIAALEDGRADAYASDQVLLIGLARKSKHPENLRLSGNLYSYEPYAMVVHQNDAAFRLVADRALAQVYRSGEIDKIYDRWFGQWNLKPSPMLIALYRVQSLPD